MNKRIRTRFAPSPTGYLHIGGLRTALYAYLHAKQNNGDFILRIEDTDQNRLVPDSVENIIETLQWAGLDFDEGPTKDGPHKPYTQSLRLPKYQEAADFLLDNGHAYRCFCTKEELDQMREEQIAAKKAPMYDRRCRYLTPDEVQQKLDNNLSFVIRQAIPLNRLIKFQDIIRGKVTFDTNTLDDQVLLKSDGFPTYHLAVIVDDHDMQITHVVRGEEWLPSTPKHLLLYEAFGYEPTIYAHLPLLLNKDRSKLSKRQNDVSTQSYIDKGYTQEAIINFIALLGWSPSDNQEIFSMEELIQQFSLDRVQKGGAVFDLDKLNWFNWQWHRKDYLQQLNQLAQKVDSKVNITEIKKGHLKFEFSTPNLEDQFLQENYKILHEFIQKYLSPENKAALQKNILKSARILKTVEEKILQEPENINQFITFYFAQNFDYQTDLFVNEKMNITSEIAIQSIKYCLNNLQPEHFTSEQSLLSIFKEFIQHLELKNGQVLWPIRVALTNEQYSPGVFEVAYILGYDETKQRLSDSLDHLQNT